MADPAPIVLNTVMLRNEASPHLTGRVLRVGPEGDFKDLSKAFRNIQPGDILRLGKGRFHLGRGQWRDIAIVGAGPDDTELALSLRAAMRVRIEGVKINCHDREFIDIRDGGAVHLKNCHIFNYNSGAGGSNAIRASGCVVFVEGCTFEGMAGRAEGRGSGGDAFDMRGDNVLFVRNTQFINNQEIIRASFPCGFDACTSKNTTQWDSGITPYQPRVLFLRANRTPVRSPESAVAFQHVTDDIAFIEYALGEREAIDDLSKQLAGTLGIARNLPYWIGLLRHRNEAVRLKAAVRVRALTGQAVRLSRPDAKAVPPEDIDRWIRELDSDDFETREKATQKLIGAGEAAREKVLAIRESGSMEQKIRAKQILGALVGEAALMHEAEFARLFRWFQENRFALTWDAKAKRYVKGK
jgi:hypothetical protein